MIRFSTIHSIDLEDWDGLIEETYGRPYSLQQQDGCKSRGVEYITVPCEPQDYERDSIPEEVNGRVMGVSFKAWLARDPSAPVGNDEDRDHSWSINLFWMRNFYPDISMVANDLHARGLLPAGEYQIVIDW